MNLSDAEIRDMIDQMDYHNNNKINYSEFLAATIDGHSEDRGPYIDEIRLDSVDFLFPSSSHRMLGSDSLPKVLWFLYYARSLTFFLGNQGNQAVRVLKHAASQDPWTCPGGQIKTLNISKVKR